MTKLVKPTNGGFLLPGKLEDILSNVQSIMLSVTLSDLPPEKLVVLYTPSKQYHMLLSLGDNHFSGLNNHLFNPTLSPDDNIISARQLGMINNGVLSGDVNVEKTRVSALLGPDSRVAIHDNANVQGGCRCF
ncbi:hypothetical protein [Sodalis sp. (in: enterobacteria)]|uniref:hypothetical protein n=1 Tax=Sodalis sp. (in: enterobacteria) TaxID=1898979 RepID=UPI003F6833CE